MAKVARRENILVVKSQKTERAVCCRTVGSSTSFNTASMRLVRGVYWWAMDMIGCAARPTNVLSKALPGLVVKDPAVHPSLQRRAVY